MKKIIALFLLVSFLYSPIYAQEMKVLNLVVPYKPLVSNSLYKDAEFLDSRPNEEYEQVKIDGSSFAGRLNQFVHQTIDITTEHGILFVQLRNLDFHENKKTTESLIRINLFERKDNDFYFIDSLTTNLIVDRNESYNTAISDFIFDYIAESLTHPYIDNEPYSINDIHNFDLIEKGKLELYNTDSYTNGVYRNFQDFADQKPIDDQIITKFKKGELKEVKVKDLDTNKIIKVNPKEVYAVVVNGQPYIATDKKFIHLYKEDDDFWYEDEITENTVSFLRNFSLSVGSGGYRGGGMGLGVVNQADKKPALYKISHFDGNRVFVRMR